MRRLEWAIIEVMQYAKRALSCGKKSKEYHDKNKTGCRRLPVPRKRQHIYPYVCVTRASWQLSRETDRNPGNGLLMRWCRACVEPAVVLYKSPFGGKSTRCSIRIRLGSEGSEPNLEQAVLPLFCNWVAEVATPLRSFRAENGVLASGNVSGFVVKTTNS